MCWKWRSTCRVVDEAAGVYGEVICMQEVEQVSMGPIQNGMQRPRRQYSSCSRCCNFPKGKRAQLHFLLFKEMRCSMRPSSNLTDLERCCNMKEGRLSIHQLWRNTRDTIPLYYRASKWNSKVCLWITDIRSCSNIKWNEINGLSWVNKNARQLHDCCYVINKNGLNIRRKCTSYINKWLLQQIK